MISKCWQFCGVLAVLAASLACSISAPGWVPPADPTPAGTSVSSPVPSQEPAKPQVESSGTPEPSRAAVSAMRSLNVRMGPSYSSAGVGWLYHGEEVELTRRCSGAWAEIIFKGSRRWVRGRYITGDTCEAE